jgi:hypothetical protein
VALVAWLLHGDRSAAANADRDWNLYETAIRLLEHDTQNLWSMFATFFVPQAVLLGFALQSLDPHEKVYLVGPLEPAFAVGVFGLVLCIPTLITHERSNLMFRLRILQALEFERRTPSHLLRQGRRFVKGHPVFGLQLAGYMRGWLNNTFYLRFLVFLWAVVDAIVAMSHAPSGDWGLISDFVIADLFLVNVGLFVAGVRRLRSTQ